MWLLPLQTCQVCKKGDNDECLLLCDGCDRGCHMYCLRPKLTQVPEGDWFCPHCVSQVSAPPPLPLRLAEAIGSQRSHFLSPLPANGLRPAAFIQDEEPREEEEIRGRQLRGRGRYHGAAKRWRRRQWRRHDNPAQRDHSLVLPHTWRRRRQRWRSE